MRRVLALLCCVVVLGPSLSAQETPPTSSALKLEFGPIVGVTYVVMGPDDFNAMMQTLFPRPESAYFPLFSEIGVFARQYTPLGATRSYLTFHEEFHIGGLDQNMSQPALKLLIGFRGPAGTELGLGPYVSLTSPENNTQVRLSLAYMVGWTVSGRGVSVPIHVYLVPVPSYSNPRITLTMGFAFGVAP
jgi:hypothetical protein